RLVQRRVPLATAPDQRLEVARDAGGLVDRELLLERHVQAHVEERVAFVGVVFVAVTAGIAQHGVVLRVRQDHIERDGLDAVGWPNAVFSTTFAVLLPTPGSSSSASRFCGTAPQCFSMMSFESATTFFALPR